ncbi:MAG: hypothetical protein LBR61_14240 [Synergistaceae bacterium]|nr:hypothetical protein [Synergistaceae bacterium]
MAIVLFKLVLIPSLVAVLTLISRRWGPDVGGWFVGLPLISGPVSAFLLMERGRDFALASARSTLHGIIAVAAFSLAYERVSRFCRWPLTVVAGLTAYFAVVALFSGASLPFGVSLFLVLSVIAFGCRALPACTEAVSTAAAPSWDLPFRMIAATAIVVVLTAVSSFLGPQLSGLLSTFPVSISVMSTFSHRLYGRLAVCRLERGVLVGSYSCVGFYVVAVLTLPTWHPAVIYSLATACALGINIFVFYAMSGKWNRERRHP